MPAPPIIAQGHLSLPAYQVGAPQLQHYFYGSSGQGGFYNTGTLIAKASGWTAKSIKSADVGVLPMLYTSGYIAALYQQNQSVIYNNKTVFAPTPAYGGKGTLLTLPKVVLLPSFQAGRSWDLGNAAWATENQSWLAANRITVVQVGQPLSPARMGLIVGLPIDGINLVPDTFGDMPAPVVDATKFLGGRCYEVHYWLDDYTDQGYSGSGFATATRDKDVATNKAVYPRFAKRKVISCGPYNMVNGDDAAINALHAATIGLLTGYGYDGTLHNVLVRSSGNPADAGTAQAFLDSLVADIKAFFGIS